MTLMVVASPCALVLSIPSAILAAIAWGARHGVLFRGGAAIEKLADINVVALDKTGTLTTGELAVVGYGKLSAGPRDAKCSSWPMRWKRNRIIRSRAPSCGMRNREACVAGTAVDDFQSITGQGLRGKIDGATLLLGRRELLESGPLAGWAKKLPPAAAELSEVWVIGRGPGRTDLC